MKTVKLDFYESDVLAWFLREQKTKFVRCANDFGYEDDEAKQMHDEIHKRIVDCCLKQLA